MVLLNQNLDEYQHVLIHIIL